MTRIGQPPTPSARVTLRAIPGAGGRAGAGAAIAVVLALTAAVTAGCSRDNTSANEPSASSTTKPGSTSSTSSGAAPDLEQVHVKLTQLATLEQPTAMAPRAGDPALYVTEQTGAVRKLAPQGGTPPSYQVESSAFVDISDDVTAGGEQGLLGITFSRDGRRLYLAYTGTDQKQHVDAWQVTDDRVDTSTRRSLLVVDDFAPNHNGGGLAFGPDGFLYYSMGDGGGAGDPTNTGQNPNDLLGSLLRIDPESGDPYGLPPSNPFASGGGAPEVWAYGLRNPWRFSFDRTTGDLWIADVGQGDWEEIDFLPASAGGGRGANLGWSQLEGTHPFRGGHAPEGAVAPIFQYDHSGEACSVTGGYVYRGSRIKAMVGAYLFADFCVGEVRALVARDGSVSAERNLGLHASNLSSFGQDADGELYVLSLDGAVYRIDPA